jgi:hypothetical protein
MFLVKRANFNDKYAYFRQKSSHVFKFFSYIILYKEWFFGQISNILALYFSVKESENHESLLEKLIVHNQSDSIRTKEGLLADLNRESWNKNSFTVGYN